MKCRSACGMCCIAPSISAPIPGMPNGKLAGERCINLDPESFACILWGGKDYPDFCRAFQPGLEFCGNNQAEAEQILTMLEAETKP